MKNQLDQIDRRLHAAGYVSEPALNMSIALVDMLKRPLLIEGDAGVGKTAMGNMLATIHDCRLIRLQCYEGLDATSAIYEWNYQKQLLSIKLQETAGADGVQQNLFNESFLLRRPLLEAISQPESPVLLIDEIDRADEQFEALLLEVLSDFQVSIPELGTLSATSIPRVVLTSNGTRELSDALRRRCLYYYLDYPTLEKELAIVALRLPHIDLTLAQNALQFVGELRKQALKKKPGVTESLDWLQALTTIRHQTNGLQVEDLMASLVCLLKTREDRQQVGPDELQSLMAVLGKL
jgi:MoxR-like ATPase